MDNLHIPSQAAFAEWLGPIDIYLLDQVLKGNLQPDMTILDAGCGHGRNMIYFLQMGYEIHGVDMNPEYVLHCRQLGESLQANFDPDRIRESKVDALPYPDQQFQAVISSAVLHFAENEAHFSRMFTEMWRVLAPGGLLFIRTASDIGLEYYETLESGRHFLPDGTERFLATERMFLSLEKKVGAKRVEPLKTTNVQNYRCMSTWVLQKPGNPS